MSTKTDVATGGYYYLPTACETLHTVLVPLLQFSTGRNSPGIISNVLFREKALRNFGYNISFIV